MVWIFPDFYPDAKYFALASGEDVASLGYKKQLCLCEMQREQMLPWASIRPFRPSVEKQQSIYYLYYSSQWQVKFTAVCFKHQFLFIVRHLM